MSKRNIAWLVAIVAVAVVGAIVFESLLLGVLLGLGGLVASEVIERSRRRRRAAASGQPVPKPLRSAVKRTSKNTSKSASKR